MMFAVWFGLATATLFLPKLAVATAVVGVLGLTCSAMIYVDTRRQFWRAAQTFPRFFGTAALVVLAATAPFGAAVLLIAKLAYESRTRYDGGVSARVQRGPLARAAALRDGLGLAAALLLVAMPGAVALALVIAGEMAERTIFFRAVDAPKMPGMPTA
jgi:DMSO reductase anchor subunit